MNPQNRTERSDTFGANTKADLALLRSINERANDHSEEIFALAILSAAALLFFSIVGFITYTIWS